VADDFERRLPDVPAAFPRPDPGLTENVRRQARRLARRPLRARRSLVLLAAVVVLATSLGFSTGHWLAPGGTAATSISFDAKPRESEAFFGTVNAFGAVASGKSDETVVIESRECDGYGQWSTAAKVVTGNGGTWIAQVGATSTATFRARWKNAVSDTVIVRVHPHMELQGPHGGVFVIRVAAGRFFDRARGTLERRSGNRWVRVRAFTLHRTSGMGQVPWTYARFRATVKRGSFVRAVLPRAETGRCYLPGISNIVRV
jgi:hypothetical protein